MRKVNGNNRSEKRFTSPAQELAQRLSREDALESEPPHRFLIAALMSFAVLVLGLVSSGCTVGQTRFALGVTLVADAATTQSALSASGASEANPVLKNAPIPIMVILSGVVSLVAEKQARNGEIKKAKTLYTIASIVHGAATAWNGYQMGKGSNGAGGTARPTALAAMSGGTPGIPGNAGPRVRY